MTELSTHTFELDLTSVCVSSGTIQLPLKMQQFFTPGPIRAEIDGQAMELEFHAPRSLTGLREHFAERGLRSNDHVRFDLEVEGGRLVGLRATCVRRERPKAPEVPPAREQGKASHVKPVGEPWETGGGVRVVKRIRIPGLSTAPGPAELVSLSSAAGGQVEDQARGRASHRSSWDSSHEQDFFDDGITTVRAVRRGGGTAEARGAQDAPAGIGGAGFDPSAAAAHAGGQQERVVRPISSPRAAPTPYAVSEERAERDRPIELSDLIAPPLEDPEAETGSRRTRRWLLPPRPRSGAPAGQRQPHTSGPSRGRAVEQPATAEDPYERELRLAHGEENLERRAKQEQARASEQPQDRQGDARPKAVATESAEAVRPPQRQSRGEAKQLVTVVAQATSPGPTAMAGQYDGRSDDPNANPFRAASGQTRGGDRAPDRSGGQRALFEAGDAASPAGQRFEPVRQQVRSEASKPAEPAQALRNTLLIDDDDFGGDYLEDTPQVPRAAPAPGSLEEDIALVKEYLGSPGTPAIVRSEALGHLLGIGEERAERALERISEEPESVSRIRRGAYMVRRRH